MAGEGYGQRSRRVWRITQIDHPDYYSKGGIEAIDYIDAHSLSFSLGNVVKYITRAGHKEDEDALTALRKALWYLKHEIELRERKDKHE
ncbi:MAG: DUF3310 domain-containing protein [Synergistaceae bacterium]|nr:DUF3310 domain-containing protein [Synergistaceae bacterium]